MKHGSNGLNNNKNPIQSKPSTSQNKCNNYRGNGRERIGVEIFLQSFKMYNTINIITVQLQSVNQNMKSFKTQQQEFFFNVDKKQEKGVRKQRRVGKQSRKGYYTGSHF